MRQKIFTLLAGMVLGMVIVSGGHAAANTVLTATPSSQMFYIDGQRVTMTAYLIGGSNYVKLRDIGEAVEFNVYWDGTVQIESDQPYTGAAPGNTVPAPTQQPSTNLTEENIQAILWGLMEIYPTNAPYGAPYVPNNPLYRPYSNCDACAGWAMKCSDAVFGDLPWRRVMDPRWEDIRPGDLLDWRADGTGHVVVVIEKNDDHVVITESGRNNKVRWAGQYPRWWLESQDQYSLRTRYPQ